jgi:hypothetical protein
MAPGTSAPPVRPHGLRPPGSPPRAGRVRRGPAWVSYAFMAPWFLGLLAFTAGHMLASLYLSLTDFDLLSTPEYVGLDNYVTMFTEDPRYFQSLTVTVVYVVLSVPLQLAWLRQVRDVVTFRDRRGRPNAGRPPTPPRRSRSHVAVQHSEADRASAPRATSLADTGPNEPGLAAEDHVTWMVAA